MMNASQSGRLLLGLSLLQFGSPAMAQDMQMRVQEGLDACRRFDDLERRLACYDALPGARVTGGAATVETEPAAEEMAEFAFPVPFGRSPMTRRWELDDATHGGLLRIRTYYPIYALPVKYSSDRNEQPSTPTRQSREFELDSVEAKFQLSLKTKLWDNLIGDNGDIWGGYTQVSNWQAYNSESAPFRETNYMPEIFLSWRTGVDLGTLRWQFVNLGLIHQSNGRGEDLSRSWNRLYAMFGLEGKNTDVYIRPWIRVLEESDDDNPDIEDYMGYGDLRVLHRKGNHDLGLLARYNVSENKGALQLGWHWPLIGDLKGYVQLFTGYGESLIDYNHKQTTVGLGASLVQW